MRSLAVVSLLLAVILAGCGGGGGPKVNPPPPVQSIVGTWYAESAHTSGTMQFDAGPTWSANVVVHGETYQNIGTWAHSQPGDERLVEVTPRTGAKWEFEIVGNTLLAKCADVNLGVVWRLTQVPPES